MSDAVEDFPAQHYLVMLWGHSYGFGFGRPGPGKIAIPDLTVALEEFRQARGGRKLEILAANTCRVGKLETVYELRDTVKYIVSSQVGVPAQGWPVRKILSDLTETPSLDPKQLAQTMVVRYCDWYRQRTLTMTMIDVDETAWLLSRIETLATAIFDEIKKPAMELRSVHEAFVLAANVDEETEPAVDLHELCTRLKVSDCGAIGAAAADILEALESPRFIVKHDGTGPNANRLHGIGCLVPHVALDTGSPIHDRLGLKRATLWNHVLHELSAVGKHEAILTAIAELEGETMRTAEAASEHGTPNLEL